MATKAKKKNKAKSTKEVTNLVLDGKVFLETKRGKKVVSREDLEGEVVLKTLLHCIETALDTYDK